MLGYWARRPRRRRRGPGTTSLPGKPDSNAGPTEHALSERRRNRRSTPAAIVTASDASPAIDPPGTSSTRKARPERLVRRRATHPSRAVRLRSIDCRPREPGRPTAIRWRDGTRELDIRSRLADGGERYRKRLSGAASRHRSRVGRQNDAESVRSRELGLGPRCRLMNAIERAVVDMSARRYPAPVSMAGQLRVCRRRLRIW